MLAPGSVPTDEQLEEELRELEKKTQGKYEIAKNDLTLPMLQKMKTVYGDFYTVLTRCDLGLEFRRCCSGEFAVLLRGGRSGT